MFLYTEQSKANPDEIISSLIPIKERELALALMRVADLSRQLEQLRQGRLDRHMLTDSTLANAQFLDQKPEVVGSYCLVFNQYEAYVHFMRLLLW